MRGYRTVGLVVTVLAIALVTASWAVNPCPLGSACSSREARAGLAALGARVGAVYRRAAVTYGPEYEAAKMTISQPRTLFVLGAALVGVGLVGRQLIGNQPLRGSSPGPGGSARPAPARRPSGVVGQRPGLRTPPA